MNKKWILCCILLLGAAYIAGAQEWGSKDQFKDEFLSRINRVRARGCNCGSTYMPPAAPLVWNDDLEQAANAHAKDMARNDYFSHTSQDGRTISDRIMKAGYTYNGYKSFAVGENIARGQLSIAEVSNGWFKSVGHCKNLMNPDFREIGIAENKTYWVQDFGGRIAFSDKEKSLIKSGRLIIKRSRGSSHE
ncbi:CAP domain-containing protein [Mucilaginibacter sp. Bleaf8]|uniref:CAP domain-containing protein n=1 Tax=Mucilaginibacter sp. Bleaf8 TaxID=2834430 RepID=UPI001BCCFB65|nr:CAP domain-containing protein [Mucilaginibacter sp. Bleaf8]MBS7562987.1 CAP domain-containing protein [Mucilaginibacter sp. Bleaf8]